MKSRFLACAALTALSLTFCRLREKGCREGSAAAGSGAAQQARSRIHTSAGARIIRSPRRWLPPRCIPAA